MIWAGVSYHYTVVGVYSTICVNINLFYFDLKIINEFSLITTVSTHIKLLVAIFWRHSQVRMLLANSVSLKEIVGFIWKLTWVANLRQSIFRISECHTQRWRWALIIPHHLFLVFCCVANWGVTSLTTTARQFLDALHQPAYVVVLLLNLLG